MLQWISSKGIILSKKSISNLTHWLSLNNWLDYLWVWFCWFSTHLRVQTLSHSFSIHNSVVQDSVETSRTLLFLPSFGSQTCHGSLSRASGLARKQPTAEGYIDQPSSRYTQSAELWFYGLMHSNKGIPANTNTILNASGHFDKHVNIQMKMTTKYVIFLIVHNKTWLLGKYFIFWELCSHFIKLLAWEILSQLSFPKGCYSVTPQ